MFTQSANNLLNAMAANDPRAMLQSLANCNQPLMHRNALAVMPPPSMEAGPGFVAGGRWNPQDYQNLLPDVAQSMDVPGWGGPGGFNSRNYYGDTFSFPLNQQFSLNNYLGGPVSYVGGAQYTSNSYSNTVNSNVVNTQSINVQIINGNPVQGPAGPQGSPGLPGGVGFVPGGPGVSGLAVRATRMGPFLQADTLPIKIRLPEPFVTTDKITYVTEAAFDPDTCTVTTKTESTNIVTGVIFLGRTVDIRGLRRSIPQDVVVDVALAATN